MFSSQSWSKRFCTFIRFGSGADDLRKVVQLAKGICGNHWHLILSAWSSDTDEDGSVQSFHGRATTALFIVNNAVKDSMKSGRDSIFVSLASYTDSVRTSKRSCVTLTIEDKDTIENKIAFIKSRAKKFDVKYGFRCLCYWREIEKLKKKWFSINWGNKIITCLEEVISHYSLHNVSFSNFWTVHSWKPLVWRNLCPFRREFNLSTFTNVFYFCWYLKCAYTAVHIRTFSLKIKSFKMLRIWRCTKLLKISFSDHLVEMWHWGQNLNPIQFHYFYSCSIYSSL